MWNEFLPRERRGWWASVLSLIINLAQPVSALAALLAIPYFGWRSMFIIAGVPAVITWAFQVRYLRESPRWLEANGRLPEAFETVRHFNPEAPEYSVVAAQTAARPAKAKSARVELRDLFHGSMLKITILAILVSVCFQVPYYSFQAWVPTYLVKAGFPIVGTLAFAFVMQLGAIPGNLLAGYLGDRYGRKWTNVVLYVLLGVIGIVYAYSVNVFELMIVGFLFVMAANIAIALTIASYIPEMFPTSVRLQGSALANAVGRAGTILSPFMVAALFQAFGIAGVFYSSLVIFVLGAIAIAIMGPETRKKSLEQIAAESMGAASPPRAAS
jgi:putative MFS transporter